METKIEKIIDKIKSGGKVNSEEVELINTSFESTILFAKVSLDFLKENNLVTKFKDFWFTNAKNDVVDMDIIKKMRDLL